MDESSTFATPPRIVVCTECRLPNRSETLGPYLIQQIQRTLDLTDQSAANALQVQGESCLAGCKYPCTVAFLCNNKTNYLFGHVQNQSDIAAIVAFAGQYFRSESGWTRSQDRPAELRGKTLARLPPPMHIFETRDGETS